MVHFKLSLLQWHQACCAAGNFGWLSAIDSQLVAVVQAIAKWVEVGKVARCTQLWLSSMMCNETAC